LRLPGDPFGVHFSAPDACQKSPEPAGLRLDVVGHLTDNDLPAAPRAVPAGVLTAGRLDAKRDARMVIPTPILALQLGAQGRFLGCFLVYFGGHRGSFLRLPGAHDDQ
jgi:hypothetical protein